MDRSGWVADLALVCILMLAIGIPQTRLLSTSRPEPMVNSRGVEMPQQQAVPQTPNGHAKAQAPVPQASAMHSITVTFDYDFTKTPACSANVKKHCVAKFSVYDISGDKPYFLFSAPVPDGAHGQMKAITATSPRLLFAVGKHRIAVSAQEPDGKESPPHDCKVIVEIKPADAGNSSGTH